MYALNFVKACFWQMWIFMNDVFSYVECGRNEGGLMHFVEWLIEE